MFRDVNFSDLSVDPSKPARGLTDSPQHRSPGPSLDVDRPESPLIQLAQDGSNIDQYSTQYYNEGMIRHDSVIFQDSPGQNRESQRAINREKSSK
jgi:hypothetical protein